MGTSRKAIPARPPRFHIVLGRDFCFQYGTMKPSGFPTALLLVSSLTTAAPAQPASLGIDRELGPARISLNAEPGFDYRLEATPAIPQSSEWDLLAILRLDSDAQSWL